MVEDFVGNKNPRTCKTFYYLCKLNKTEYKNENMLKDYIKIVCWNMPNVVEKVHEKTESF